MPTTTPQHIIGIEMSDSHLTCSVVRSTVGVAQAGGNVSYALHHVDRRIIPPGAVGAGHVVTEAPLIDLLKLFAQECARFAPARFCFSIPTARMMSHVFTFPADFSDTDIEDALQAQIEEYFPFDAEDCLFWWRTVHRTELTQTLFVCATSRGFVERWKRVFTQSGIQIDFVDIEPMNILRSVTPFVQKNAAVIVLDIGRRMTYISAIDQHGLRDLKVLHCPLAACMEKNPSVETVRTILQPIIHDIQALMRLLHELYRLPVAQVFVCGKGAQYTEVMSVLTEHIEKEVVPYGRVHMPLERTTQRYFTAGLPFEYANSIGVALGAAQPLQFAPKA